MSRLARLLVPLTAIAALIVLGMLCAPVGARGSDSARSAVARPGGTDRYSFGQDVVIDRPVHGNVQVWFGSAEVRDVIVGDLLVMGPVIFSGAGHVTGNVIATTPVSDAAGRVDGKILTPGSVETAMAMLAQSPSESRGLLTLVSIAIKLSLLLGWLVTAVVLTLVSPREVRMSSIEIRSSALHCFALGLVALTSFVLTAIVFSILVSILVGIPLLVVLALFAIVTKVYGMVAVFHAVGTLIAGSRTREQLARRRWLRGDLAMAVVGVLVLGAIRMIPVVGTIVWGCASVFGVGVALATKFGRREPWFLAWRPAES